MKRAGGGDRLVRGASGRDGMRAADADLVAGAAARGIWARRARQSVSRGVQDGAQLAGELQC